MYRTAALVVIAAALPAAADVSWSFDADAEGWGTLNDARDFTWDGALGQPAGSIRAEDAGNGPIWYFAAPAADISNAAGMYGGEISWDILGLDGNHTSISGRADVMLTGAGMEIGVDIPLTPLNGQWTSWSVSVDDMSGWETVTSLSSGNMSGSAVSEADIRAVLGDLQGFYIQGEYTNGGGDETALDNVSFVPAPGAAALLGLGGLAMARRRR